MKVKVRPRYLVFVSHSSRDTWIARQIARGVHEAGAKPFLDEAHIEIGAQFEREIRTVLNRADELVVLLSPWALDRPYVWAELGAAWIRDIPIVALLLGISPEELQARPGIPAFLKERDLIDLNSADTYFKQLTRRIERQRKQIMT
jgi:hypothetical protein